MKYGDYSLNQPGRLWVTETDVYNAPENVVQADELTETDGAIVVKQRYKSKIFSVIGVLRGDSIEDTDALIDEFKEALSRKNMSFDVPYAGGLRRYLATARNIIITRRRGLTTATWSVEFISPDGMGWDLQSIALLEPTGITESNVTSSMTVEGSYKAEPLIEVTVNTVTDGTGKTITLSNANTLRSIRITRDWDNGDKLEIDCQKKTVFVNDVAHDFRGQFLEFEPGDTSIGYIDDFTTRDVTISASYTRRWL